MSIKNLYVGFGLIPFMAACNGDKNTDVGVPLVGAPISSNDSIVNRSVGAATRAAPTRAAPTTILFLGTSLTAGYGLRQDQAFPAIIARKADSARTPIQAMNAGVSGETSAGLLRRLDWVLKNSADVIVIETGANDGLRALNVDSTRENISAIVKRVKQKQPDAKIVLVAMQAPPNLGFMYTRAFSKMYQDIADDQDITLAPFLLEGVAGVADYNQADGVHPNPRGAEIVAENVWRVLRDVVTP